MVDTFILNLKMATMVIGIHTDTEIGTATGITITDTVEWGTTMMATLAMVIGMVHG